MWSESNMGFSIYLAWAILLRLALADGDDDPPSCYFPNGDIDTGSVACDVGAVQEGGHTMCCKTNDLCFDSGVCYQGWSGIMYRQSCTDPTFNDPACGQICLEDQFLTNGAYLQTCDMLEEKACCLTDRSSCCDDEKSYFDFAPGEMVAVLDLDGNNRLDRAADTSVSILTVYPKPTSSSSSTQTTGSAAAATDGSDNDQDSSSSSNHDGALDQTGAIAGLVVLGVLLLASLAALGLLWSKYDAERKKHAKYGDAMFSSSTPMTGTYGSRTNGVGGFDGRPGDNGNQSLMSTPWDPQQKQNHEHQNPIPPYYHHVPVTSEHPETPQVVHQSELEGHLELHELGAANYRGK